MGVIAVLSVVALATIGFLNTVSGSGIAEKQPGMGMARIVLGLVLHIVALLAAYAVGVGAR